MMLAKQNEGIDGLGGTVSRSGRDLVLMTRGQNIGYKEYMLIFPATDQGIMAMTSSDNGTVLIRRAATAYHWPGLGTLVV